MTDFEEARREAERYHADRNAKWNLQHRTNDLVRAVEAFAKQVSAYTTDVQTGYEAGSNWPTFKTVGLEDDETWVALQSALAAYKLAKEELERG